MVSSRIYRHRETTGQMQATSRDVFSFHPIFTENARTKNTKNNFISETMEHMDLLVESNL